MKRKVINLYSYENKLERLREELERTYQSIAGIEKMVKEKDDGDSQLSMLNILLKTRDIIVKGCFKTDLSVPLDMPGGLNKKDIEDCLFALKSELVLLKTVELENFRSLSQYYGFLVPFVRLISREISNLFYWTNSLLELLDEKEGKSIFPSEKLAKELRNVPKTKYFPDMGKVIRSVIRQMATGEISYKDGLEEMEDINIFLENTLSRTL